MLLLPARRYGGSEIQSSPVSKRILELLVCPGVRLDFLGLSGPVAINRPEVRFYDRDSS
jgi:hypothetical protein